MFGISSHNKEAIDRIVDDMFDRIALQFLGNIPKLQYKKLLLFSTKPNLGLANLFVEALNNRTPNIFEQDALKSMLQGSHGYIESLKNKVRSNVTERIDGLAKEAKVKKTRINESDINSVLEEEFRKSRSHLKTIVDTESTKVRNIGTAVDIGRVSSSIGDSDPSVYFMVVRDDHTCDECLRLHFMPDQVTPRVYKLSELSHGFHKKGTDTASVQGLHPNCRCTLVYISKGFGFDKNGKIKYESLDYNIHSKQRK